MLFKDFLQRFFVDFSQAKVNQLFAFVCNNFTWYNQGINKLWHLYIILRHCSPYLVLYCRLKYKLNSSFDMKVLKYLSRDYFALIKLHQNLLDFSNRLTNDKCSSQTQSQTGPATYFTGAWHWVTRMSYLQNNCFNTFWAWRVL